MDNKNYPIQYGYDNQNRPNKIILPEGLVLNYAYNEAGKIINAKYQLPSTGLWQSVGRKLNILKEFHTLSTNNPIDQVANASHKNNHQDITYTLDANNNRLSRYDNGVITTYDYQTNTDRLTHINHPEYQAVYEYNQVGSPTKITKTDKNNKVSTQTISYTPDNQIKAIYQDDNLVAEYDYNHLRQRIEKTVYLKDNKTNQIQKETTNYLWHNGLLSAEIQNGNITRRYIYMDITPIAVIDYTYNSKSKMMTAQAYTVHTDQLGTPKKITNQNNQIVWQADYEDFGKATVIAKDNFQFNLRFAGQYYDNETGYHYNANRYYNPETGRYLTADPLGLSGGLNSYVYANHEPWKYVDVLGLYTLKDASAKLALELTPMKGTRRVVTGGSPTRPSIVGRYRMEKCYSDEQIFEAWLELERSNTAWLKELNDRKCPATLLKARENPQMWGGPIKIDVSKATAWVFHPGAAWDVRSKPTKGGHTNQCTYDSKGGLIKHQRPAAGTADYRACRVPGFCPEHVNHDVDPYRLAVNLHNKYYGKDYPYNQSPYINAYYSVRPTIY